MKKSKILNIILIEMLLLPALFAGCARGEAASPTPNPKTQMIVPGFLPGNLAPDFRYQNEDGQTVSLSNLRGRPVILNFWASWCPPCRLEMPLFEEIYHAAKWKDSGVALLAINKGEDYSTVEKFMQDNGYSFPFVLDTQLKIASAYNVGGIPVTFFISKDGVIISRKLGAFFNKAEIEKELSKITD